MVGYVFYFTKNQRKVLKPIKLLGKQNVEKRMRFISHKNINMIVLLTADKS